MIRREFLKSAGLSLAACVLDYAPAAAAKKPNVLVIVIDDLGWHDVGYHGSEILTPHIDRLAAESIRLEQHYVAPTCSPTRTALLTGRFPSRYGVLGPTNERVFQPSDTTLASALRDCGYNTSLIGKWHLGSAPEWGPNQHGFDYAYGSLAGGVHPYNHRYKHGPYSETWHRNGQHIEEDGHVTDLLGREAVARIEAAASSSNPFFMYVAFTAVHIPIAEPEQWTAMYDGRIDDPSRKRFAACATHMDHWVGELMSALARTGQRDDTVIVFTSDNGAQEQWNGVGEYPGDDGLESPVLGRNTPLRGWKGELFEGAIRVPAFVHYPKALTPGSVTAPVHIADWMPTLCGLASCPVPEDHAFDGMDVWPVLRGADTPSRTMYWRTPNLAAIREDDWKLVESSDGTRQLFNLAEDPFETADRAPEYPERAASLARVLEAQRARDRREDLPFMRAEPPAAPPRGTS